jgi:hypothetical protein
MHKVHKIVEELIVRTENKLKEVKKTSTKKCEGLENTNTQSIIR